MGRAGADALQRGWGGLAVSRMLLQVPLRNNQPPPSSESWISSLVPH